jgi:acyl-CoA reductase-like NAD-dependent aldehyde dehydrogenase
MAFTDSVERVSAEAGAGNSPFIVLDSMAIEKTVKGM